MSSCMHVHEVALKRSKLRRTVEPDKNCIVTQDVRIAIHKLFGMRTNTVVGLGGKLRECFDLKASVPNDKILAIIMTHHKKIVATLYLYRRSTFQQVRVRDVLTIVGYR